jgi:radical SAM protein with 4Fe4S-binding SPASM domain
MNLNRYILPVVTKSGQEIYFNTITKEKYRKDLDESFYRERLCLEGQEIELIKKQMFKPPTEASFLVTNTWECSLRCGHCCVIDKLKKEETNDINILELYDFLERYRDAYMGDNKKFIVHVAFAGGEVGLRPKQAVRQVRAFKEVFRDINIFYCNATTNLYYDITDEHMELFNELNNFTVSIDGLEEDHNKQRKSFGDYKVHGNPFQKTVNNLTQLLDQGFAEKINIQASLKDEIHFDIEKKLAFFEYFIRKGMYVDHIKWNALFPTKRNPALSEAFKKSQKHMGIVHSPCCKFRFMSRIQLDPDGKLYSDYFQNDFTKELCFLGTLTSGMQEVEDQYKNMILQEMPIFKDKNCMTCPVLGYCWGKCINANVVAGFMPSEVCNQKELTKDVFDRLARGELSDYGLDDYCKVT